MVVRKPSSLFSVSTSRSSSSSSKVHSRYPPSAFSTDREEDEGESDSDSASDSYDETMSVSTDDYVPSRPLSVAVPKSHSLLVPYVPRRPSLREILADASEAPWTLAAFMAYLSNNHCLETLEFTMDAGRYKKHYAKMMSRATNGMPPGRDRDFVKALWQRLVEAYIQPNGSREVNLPSDVRDPILNRPRTDLPPPPDALDPAVATIFELMEESVLVPFLNSVWPPAAAHAPVSSLPPNHSKECVASYDDHSAYTARRSRHGRSATPPQHDPHHASSYHPSSTLSPASRKSSSPSAFAHGLSLPGRSHRFSVRLSSPSTSTSTSAAAPFASTGSDLNLSSSSSAGPGTTDDTDSSPPRSPQAAAADAHSPKRDSGVWKKLGRFGGMKPHHPHLASGHANDGGNATANSHGPKKKSLGHLKDGR